MKRCQPERHGKTGFYFTAQSKKKVCLHTWCSRVRGCATRRSTKSTSKKIVSQWRGTDQKDVLYGKYEVLEGAEVQGVVILEFPTVADAKAYYDSPAYREAREHRFKAADYRVLIVEGVQPA
jgi:uncharacterized protein (DUF1330 family)